MKKVVLGSLIFISACFTDKSEWVQKNSDTGKTDTLEDISSKTDVDTSKMDTGKDFSDVTVDMDETLDVDTSDVDITAPTISNTSPEDGATLVAKNNIVTVTFSENILAQTINATNFTLTDSKGDAISGVVTFDEPTNVATFTPNEALGLLGTYTATLNTMITDLGANSLITDYSWSFTTVDGTWGNPSQIAPNNSGDAHVPQIAFDHLGNAIAVWQQGNPADIWAKGFDGTDWGNPILIESNNSWPASKPQIAFDHLGNAIAVWAQSDGTRVNIWANRYDGSNWSNPTLLESANSGGLIPISAKIAFDHQGNAIAVWHQTDGTRINIWANRFNGSGWGTASLIEANDAGDAVFPQVAFDHQGNAIAVWGHSDGTRTNIWANRFDGNSWGNAILIESNDAGDAGIPQIAFDHQANAIAVWIQNDGTRWDVWANRFDGNNWSGAERIEAGAGDANEPEIAFDKNGNGIVVWTQSDGTHDNIWSNRFSSGSWGSPTLIEKDDAGDAQEPQIAVDHQGNVLAVWRQSDGTRDNIWANRFAGDKWMGAGVIENNDVAGAMRPQVAVDQKGNAIAVWRQHDGNDWKVWTNHFR